MSQISADDKLEGQAPKTSAMLRTIARYVGRHPWMFAFVIVCVFAAAAASRALPWVIGQAVDQAIRIPNAELFLRFAYLYLALEVSKTLFHFLHTYYFQVFGNRMLFYVRQDLYRHVMNLPLEYFNKTPVGRTVTRMTNDTGALAEMFSEGLVAVFTQSVVLLTTLIAMALISWKLTLIALITAPIWVSLAWYLMNKIQVLLHATKAKLSAMNAFLSENLSGIRVVQLYGKVDRQITAFDQLSGDYRTANLKMIKSYAWLQPVLNLLNACVVTGALLAGGILSLEDEIALGALITFLMYAQDFIFPIREILEKLQQFQNSLTSAQRVFALLEEPAEVQDGTLQSPRLRGDIEFRGLTFRYRPELPPVLQDVSFQIIAGESVALVGRTGSGKSSLISLLQRFYDAPAGQLLLDGHPIEDYPREALRRRLGVIQQDPVLFRGSLEFNIGLGNPEVTRERIEASCRRVGLKLKPDTFVEERGTNLSLGERQLVSFARILAFDPDLLIMDEATANVDSETERLLQKATREVTAGRTSILIAHRLSTIEDCDRVIVLNAGRVAEIGSPAELRSREGLFAQLAAAGLKSTEIEASAGGTAVP